MEREPSFRCTNGGGRPLPEEELVRTHQGIALRTVYLVAGDELTKGAALRLARTFRLAS
jgi:hypothetical protein